MSTKVLNSFVRVFVFTSSCVSLVVSILSSLRGKVDIFLLQFDTFCDVVNFNSRKSVRVFIYHAGLVGDFVVVFSNFRRHFASHLSGSFFEGGKTLTFT